MELQLFEFTSSSDHSRQPLLLARAHGDTPRPLLVGLHTWSNDLHQKSPDCIDFCREHNWSLLYPDFLGPNRTGAALGSDAAVSDIIDAVQFAGENAPVDPERIYLIGGSGGGHMSLLMAGRHPEVWAAVSAWCPISDVGMWFKECSGTIHQTYADHIFKACGGDPSHNPEAEREALHRSPVHWLKPGRIPPLCISTGIHDGHTGSVPVSHAINAFNLLAAPDMRIAPEEISFIVREEQLPEKLRCRNQKQFGDRAIHLLHRSGNVQLALFEGGHDLLAAPALQWLSCQRRGVPAVWECGEFPQTASGVEALGK